METRLPALLHAADMQRVHAVPARTKDNSSSNPYAVQEIWADEDDGAQWSGAFRLRPAIADDELTHVVLVTKMMHGDDRAVATNGHNYYDPVTVHRQVQLVATAVPRGVLIDYPPFV